MAIPVLIGSVDCDVTFKVVDSSTFEPETGVTSASGGLALWYRKGAAGALIAITAADHTNLTDAHSDGKIKHISDGLYRLSLPDAAIPTAEGEVTTFGGTVTGMQVLGGAIVGAYTIGAPAGASVSADIAAIEAQTDDIGAAGAGLTAITALLPAALVSGRMDASVGAMASGVLTATAIAADAITDAKVAADVTIASVTGAVGSVTGAVGSVTGAVGSVTGNVGGNVTGSVGSVVGAVGSVTGNVGGSVASVAAGGITAASIATDAIDADALAADAVAEIAAGGSGASPQTFWEYANRTLTMGAAAVVAAVTGDSVTVYRGTRWSITLTGLPVNTGYTSIMFSVKRDPDDADADAILLARTTTGLVYFTGAPTITAGQAAISVPSSTSITVVVEGATTQYADPGIYAYGVKMLDASGYPSQASIGGSFVVAGDLPRAVT